jgi:hypothetical protein
MAVIITSCKERGNYTINQSKSELHAAHPLTLLASSSSIRRLLFLKAYLKMLQAETIIYHITAINLNYTYNRIEASTKQLPYDLSQGPNRSKLFND